MRTHLTYHFENGVIWRWSQIGQIRARWEAFATDRALAQRIHDQHAESAKTGDWFARRATELRDEMSEAIHQYDRFYVNQKEAA